MFVLFATTYICEQRFLFMNFNKLKFRSQLTYQNLHSTQWFSKKERQTVYVIYILCLIISY